MPVYSIILINILPLLQADVPDVVRHATVNHRCALRVFECSDEDSNDRAKLFIFPKASVTSRDDMGVVSTRMMCSYADSQYNATGKTKGFDFRNWMKIGEKYTTAQQVFRCSSNSEKIIQGPSGKDLCVLADESEIPVTNDTLIELFRTIESMDKAKCSINNPSIDGNEKGVCHPPPKSLADLPRIEPLETTEYAPNEVIYFESGKDISQRNRKHEKFPSYPHGWCYTTVDGLETDNPVILDLAPFLSCPCSPKNEISVSDDEIQFGIKFTHQEWSKGKRIRRKHLAGHPGYDHSLPYSCDQICAPHFGFSRKEIQQFRDRQALLNAIKERQEYFERHENDPTKPCVIPKGARKTVGCRCAIRSRQRTPVQGTSRSFVSVGNKSPQMLSSPTMLSASAPSVSSSFSAGDQKWKSPIPKRPHNLAKSSKNQPHVFSESEEESEGAESWFPLFLSWSYSAACGSGSTSALCEWWDFLQFITESTALALSTICDAFRWTF